MLSPQPAATGAVMETLALNAELVDLLPFLQTADLASEPQLRGMCKSLARIIEAAAVAAAKRMTGGV
ncbi:hypothetical protein [Cypionkella sp. TWP1-2-1b2]|uniref:hypothetical protein n=1 Tax=Cypionkella sp. TWP1-2-1b2 TaxID=2804675 RepID=UPI003CF55619